LPSRVTGLRAISIIDEMTFIPECQASSNSSHRGLALGESWRRILKRTVLSAIPEIFYVMSFVSGGAADNRQIWHFCWPLYMLSISGSNYGSFYCSTCRARRHSKFTPGNFARSRAPVPAAGL
jgi:hypothetical protein